MARTPKDALGRLATETATLEEATKRPDLNELEKAGASARFCIAFELAYKTVRFVLIDSFGRGSDVTASPKPILRMALQDGLISDIAVWFKFLESRNSFAHIYN